jgi:hypothetical protein
MRLAGEYPRVRVFQPAGDDLFIEKVESTL